MCIVLLGQERYGHVWIWNQFFQFHSPSCLNVTLYACFQPSPYLRLLESQMQPGHKHGHLENQHMQVQSVYHNRVDQSGFQTPEAQFNCQTTEPWSRHQPQASYPTPDPQSSLQCLSVSATQLLTLKHVLKPQEQPSITSKPSETLLFSTPALGGMLQRLKILEDKTTQVNAATEQKVDSIRFPMLHGSLKSLWASFCMLPR